MRSWILVVGLAPLLAVTAVRASERVERIRHSVDPQKTRVVLDLDEPTPYELVRLDDFRWRVHFPHAAPAAASPVEPNRGPVRAVGPAGPGSPDVVLELRGNFPVRHFALDADRDFPARVVLDVQGPDRAASDRSLAPPRAGRPYVVVLDPGHGGEDTGTIGCGIVHEKNVALGVAQAMEAMLRTHPGIQVILTRDRDVQVPLTERVDLARRHSGDLFVSIHANSAPNPNARGAEVYFLSEGTADDQASKELADLENAAALVGASSEAESDLLSILVDLQGSSVLERSSRLAELSLRELARTGGVASRAVKQAGFAVLRSLSMPSILVEVGFLSHPAEARRLRAPDGQRMLASSLSRAVIEYLTRHGERGPVEPLALLRTHRVARGDTLWELARAYRTSVEALREINRLPDANLRVGQSLLVPD